MGWAEAAEDGIAAALSAMTDPEQAGQMAAYMRDQFVFLGIKAPPRDRAWREVRAGGDAVHGPPDADELVRFTRAIWQRPQREYRYVGARALAVRATLLGPRQLHPVRELLTTDGWWTPSTSSRPASWARWPAACGRGRGCGSACTPTRAGSGVVARADLSALTERGVEGDPPLARGPLRTASGRTPGGGTPPAETVAAVAGYHSWVSMGARPATRIDLARHHVDVKGVVMIESGESWGSNALKTDLGLFLVVLVVLFPLFFLTADRSPPYNIDTFSNVLTASAIGRTGSPVLRGNEALADPGAFGVVAWVRDSERGPVSKYPPGAALVAAPFYAFSSEGEAVNLTGTNDPTLAPVPVVAPPLWPSAVAASLASAIAAALLVLVVRELTDRSWAIAVGTVAVAGTSLWLNGAHQLWQHGIAAMWIALGLYLASRRSWFGSGVSMGLAVLTRPTVAVAALGIGAGAGWRDRDWRPTMRHGTGAVLGLVALLAYNNWLWGELTITGGYGSGLGGSLIPGGPAWFVGNVLGGLFSLDRGLLVWSPVLAVAACGLPAVWRRLPGWATGGLIGGILLLLLQFALNRYSGGFGFFAYRYPIETVVAAVPALAVAARERWSRSRLWRRLLVYSVAASTALHLMAVAVQTAN